MTSDDIVAWQAEERAALRLLLVDGLGQGRLRALRREFGGAEAVLAGDAASFARAAGVEVAVAARMLRDARALGIDAEVALLESRGVRPVFEGDAGYPDLLVASHDPPAMLFVRGQLASAAEPAVAIVGSRSATTYGRVQSGRIAAELAARGVTVVSGGARGIDAEAHRGALRAGGRTIAVLATGTAHPYPAEHAGLFDSIVGAGGCAMTEQPPSVVARPDLFPRRNRMIAALAVVTVVVEAANRSGALLTARIAVEDLSREAACVPGPVDSATSEGCHRAIREGWAQLVTGADDICELLEGARTLAAGARELARRAPGSGKSPHVAVEAGKPKKPQVPPPELSADAREVLAAIRGEQRAGLDELERKLGWIVPRIACATLELEIKGLAARDAEGAFRVR